jgi:hypothetical protein
MDRNFIPGTAKNMKNRNFFPKRQAKSRRDLAKGLERLTANAKVAQVLGLIPATMLIVRSLFRIRCIL